MVAGGFVAETAGGNLTPHVLTVMPGEVIWETWNENIVQIEYLFLFWKLKAIFIFYDQLKILVIYRIWVTGYLHFFKKDLVLFVSYLLMALFQMSSFANLVLLVVFWNLRYNCRTNILCNDYSCESFTITSYLNFDLHLRIIDQALRFYTSVAIAIAICDITKNCDQMQLMWSQSKFATPLRS